jgi:hypothetical protein
MKIYEVSRVYGKRRDTFTIRARSLKDAANRFVGLVGSHHKIQEWTKYNKENSLFTVGYLDYSDKTEYWVAKVSD